MANIDHLPVEVVEHIILFLDPIDVAKLSQTHSAYYNLIYNAEDEHLWRELYLQQPFDDPRKCYNSLGRPLQHIDWKGQLQCIMRARTVLTNLSACHPDERCTILRTLVNICTVIPVTHPDTIELSLNHVWVAAMLRACPLLEYDGWEPSPEERQLRARLHSYFGLTPTDFQPSKRTESRAFVYAMRHYKYDNDFGPFLMDGSGRVNWYHIQTIHHIMSMHIVPATEETESAEFNLFPMSMPWTQSVLPDGINLDEERDWAGVAGRWQCSFCFCDHRELLIYNGFNVDDTTPLDTDIFDHPDFVEVFRSIYVELSVLGIEEDLDHPSRPRINFGGSIDGNAVIVGYVKVTPDDQIRWHFTSGEQGNSIWSSEGVQVGNVRSKFGVLGSWTTVVHDRHDPVGPFWLWKTGETEEEI